MSMDVYGNLTLVARPKQDLTIKEQMFRNIKEFKERVASLPVSNFDSHFQNLLEDYCPKLHRYNFDEDESLDIKINSSEKLELLNLLDLGLYDNVGPKDGYPFREIFEEKAIKIYDENIASGESPYITKEGEKDSFHLGYNNYGNFLYLMVIETFNENLDRLNENSYKAIDKFEKLDKEFVIKCFDKAKRDCIESLEQHKSLFSNEENYNKIYRAWNDKTYLDYEFYIAFEGYIC